MLPGADLAISNIEKIHPKHFYNHYQYTSNVDRTAERVIAADASSIMPSGALEHDDFHSPVQPTKYIKTRIQPCVAFYTRRIPIYTRQRARSKRTFELLVCAAYRVSLHASCEVQHTAFSAATDSNPIAASHPSSGYIFKVALLLLIVSSSFLARYEQVAWTTIVTSAAASITSWIEFSDSARKLERYTRLVRALKNLLSWWNSLSEVEKASTETIATLVCTSEDILSEERLAWISTSNKKGDGAGSGQVTDDDKNSTNSSKTNESIARTNAITSSNV